MFENFRERLQMVQQDFTAGFKTLGEKSREGPIKRKSRTEDSFSAFTGGLELLHRYEENWFLLHRRTKDGAQAAEAVYGDMVMLSAYWDRTRSSLTQLQDQLQNLPAFLGELDAVTTSIAQLEGEFEELESQLGFLETLCSQSEQQNLVQQHQNQLEAYRKKKRKELDSLQVELGLEHALRAAQLERALQQKLKERQKLYEDAFRQDLDQYLSTGCLQSREPAGPAVCVLDQVTVANVSDQEALDQFLNSSDEDASSGSSPTSGPDRTSCSSGSWSQAPPTREPPPGVGAGPGPGWQQEEGGSEEDDDPVVQSDEEDVEVDGLQDAAAVSEDSDSAGDPPPGVGPTGSD